VDHTQDDSRRTRQFFPRSAVMSGLGESLKNAYNYRMVILEDIEKRLRRTHPGVKKGAVRNTA
jgi:hypothetical protein